MRPLGDIRSYEAFLQEFQEVINKDRAIGFLLDCPRTSSLKKSGLIDSPKSVMAMDELMGSQMSIFYLDARSLSSSDLKSSREYRELALRFNEQIILGLRLPFRVSYPCLILFKPKDGGLGDRMYVDLGENTCFYFSDLYQAISDYLAIDNDSLCQRSQMMNSLKKSYQIAKEELPKTIFLKTLEFGIGGVGAIIASFIGIAGS